MKLHKYPEENPENDKIVLAFKLSADMPLKINDAVALHYIDRKPHWMDANGYMYDDKDIDRWIYVEDIVSDDIEVWKFYLGIGEYKNWKNTGIWPLVLARVKAIMEADR